MSADVDVVPGIGERLPTLRDRSDDAISRITDVVFDTVGRPLKSASLFYALYYAVEIEGVQEAAFDFKQLRERQSLGFWWYGTFSMAAEFANACERYFIVGDGLLLADMGPSIREHAEEFLFPDDEDMAAAANLLMQRACQLKELTTQRNLVGYEQLFDWIRARHADGWFDGLGPWVEIARDMFQAMPQGGTSPGTMRRDDKTGWSVNFNGPAWVAIGNLLLRRGELSDTAYVDQCWALEHNNRHWFDKIDAPVEGPDEAATRAVLPATRDSPIDRSNVLGATIEVLDANREGDMATVFAAATEYQRTGIAPGQPLGVNLRRVARDVGVLER